MFRKYWIKVKFHEMRSRAFLVFLFLFFLIIFSGLVNSTCILLEFIFPSTSYFMNYSFDDEFFFRRNPPTEILKAVASFKLSWMPS